MALSWSRSRDALSNSRVSAADSILSRRSLTTASVLPSMNMTTWSMTLRYSSLSAAPMHGATHRLIWYSRQGRESLPVISLVQER